MAIHSVFTANEDGTVHESIKFGNGSNLPPEYDQEHDYLRALLPFIAAEIEEPGIPTHPATWHAWAVSRLPYAITWFKWTMKDGRIDRHALIYTADRSRAIDHAKQVASDNGWMPALVESLLPMDYLDDGGEPEPHVMH